MRHSNEDARLAARALSHNWDVPDAKRAELVETIVDIALDVNQKARTRISAYRALMRSEAISLESIKTAIRAEEHESIRGRIAALEEGAFGDRNDDRWADHGQFRSSSLPPRAHPPQDD